MKIKNYQKKNSEILNLKVELDTHSGFCFGVVNAIKKAEENLNNNEILYCVGELVHNDEEIQRLKKKGLQVINQADLKDLKDKKILFRAHGEPPESYKQLKLNNNALIDASCPIILKLQKRIRQSYELGEKILIYGKINHPEIKGLQGQINNQAIVFEKVEDIDTKNLPKNITLYSQTTMNKDDFYKVYTTLKKMDFNPKMNDTTCKEVSGRKEEISQFVKKFDKVVFIAGKNSSNGKVLYNICKQANQNTFFISTLEMINMEWFQRGESVGICGATSTPVWLMQKVKLLLESF